jgi:hypothetical protein
MYQYVEFIETCASRILPFIDKMVIDLIIVALATWDIHGWGITFWT